MMMAKGCATRAPSVLHLRGRKNARERPNEAIGHEREEQHIILHSPAGRKDVDIPFCWALCLLPA